MEKDVLSQVIDAEKEIQKCLEAEKQKVREWIEGVKKESEDDFFLEQQKIKESLERSIAEAARQAEAATEEVVRAATAAAERLGRLGPGELRALVARRIAVILPG